MGVLKHLKTIFPLPRKWDADDELKKFGLRLEDAYRWLQTQRDQDYGMLTKRIRLTSGDTTWAKIWDKINVLGTYEAAVIYIYYTSMSTLSGGALASYSCGGVIWRTATGAFRFHLGNTNNDLIEASITGASDSSRGSFSYTSLKETASEKAKMIYLTSSDNTWAKIWAKINTLEVGDSATLFLHSTAANILSGGTYADYLIGTIGRGTSSFRLSGMNQNDQLVAMTLNGNSSGSTGFSFENTTETAQNAAWGLQALENVSMLEFIDHATSATAVASLDDIPMGSWGRTYLKAALSPSGSAATVNTLCFGGSNNNKTLLAAGASNIYINTKSSGSWGGWKKFTITNA